MKTRWFECPCGVEFWTPNVSLGPEPLGDGCWICRWRIARYWMWFIQAGSSSGISYWFYRHFHR